MSDFQSFELHDLDEDNRISFALANLPAYVESFGFIMGVQRRTFRDQDPVNIEVSAAMGRLHDALKTSGYGGHDLEVFLVRTVFCLFADDTGIFEPRDIFLDLLETRTREDGSDLGGWLARLFQVLNTPVDQSGRPHSMRILPAFPTSTAICSRHVSSFPTSTRKCEQRYLMPAANSTGPRSHRPSSGRCSSPSWLRYDRRAQGAHYTTEKNILKVIEPLFLDDLRAEFERLKST